MDRFQAYRIHTTAGSGGADVVRAGFENLAMEDLSAGEVVVRVEYSGVNYKDALAATGAARILRRSPLIGGIDLAGRVVRSEDARYRDGDAVLVTGCGLSETHDGGYAGFARLPGDWVIPIPAPLDSRTAMAIGTAGFTAAYAIDRMEQNGLQPAAKPVVITGASGGVGSLAIDLLSARGYEVVAVTGKPGAAAYLTSIGAARVLLRQELELGTRPLEAARWSGAIDTVGGDILTWLTRTMDVSGSIASVGLAASAVLSTTVMPFILRGVNLLGISSSSVRRPERLRIWERLSTDLRPRHFETLIVREIAFAALPSVFEEYLKGNVTGRTVVRIGH
jgi:NADPH2:quinone reductase